MTPRERRNVTPDGRDRIADVAVARHGDFGALVAVLHPDVALRSRRRCGRALSVMGFTVTDGRIVAIDMLSDPTRIADLDLAVLDDSP